MSTRKVLKEMLENCLGAAYQQEIRNRYQRNVEKDVYGVEEREYDAGIAELIILFSQEKKAQLAEYEKTCSSLREYAARYGFLAGIYCGFKQYFTSAHEADGGFTKYVCDEIHRMPKMKRHREYYADIERRNSLAEAMDTGSTGKAQYHIVSVECAWDQRSYSASIDGFYLGYHAAVAILEEIEPYSFPALKLESNILCMEHRLGYIKTHETR